MHYRSGFDGFLVCVIVVMLSAAGGSGWFAAVQCIQVAQRPAAPAVALGSGCNKEIARD